MHDIHLIRAQPDWFDAGLVRRGLPPMAKTLWALDDCRRTAITRVEELQATRNRLSAEIGQLKRQGIDAEALMAQVAALKEELAEREQESKQAVLDLQRALEFLPNLPADGVPDGGDEAANIEVRRWGNIRTYEFTPQSHEVLAPKLGGMEFETAAKISGSRFTFLKGGVARLHRALAQFMLDLHSREFGYTEVDVPLLVRDQALYGTGQLPKFSEDMFRTTDDRWLIPTAEVSLTAMVMDSIMDERELPMRLTAGSYCFRSEIGAAGRDTTGFIRQHQFFKVELVSITKPEDSEAEQERMTACAEEVLKRLELPYRVMLLCTGDMGFSARKTYDLEVWLPGQNRYREISSCSNCGDFQARRMRARYRRVDTSTIKFSKTSELLSGLSSGSTEFVHTLNGSGVAVGRALIAVLENYQQADGSVAIPTVLQPYMGGLKAIESA
jgi:seryl-tRNA synthetase